MVIHDARTYSLVGNGGRFPLYIYQSCFQFLLGSYFLDVCCVLYVRYLYASLHTVYKTVILTQTKYFKDYVIMVMEFI